MFLEMVRLISMSAFVLLVIFLPALAYYWAIGIVILWAVMLSRLFFTALLGSAIQRR